jgi:hypothetical protein
VFVVCPSCRTPFPSGHAAGAAADAATHLPLLDDEAPARLDPEEPPAVAPSVPGHSSSIDDPQVEELAQHRAKMGRYRRDVCRSIQDQLWWQACAIFQRATEPLAHAMRLFQKRHCDDPENGTSGCRLTCGDAARVFKEFEQPFLHRSWARDISMSDAIDAPMCTKLLTLQVELSLHCAAAFDRRIVEPNQERSP